MGRVVLLFGFSLVLALFDARKRGVVCDFTHEGSSLTDVAANERGAIDGNSDGTESSANVTVTVQEGGDVTDIAPNGRPPIEEGSDITDSTTNERTLIPPQTQPFTRPLSKQTKSGVSGTKPDNYEQVPDAMPRGMIDCQGGDEEEIEGRSETEKGSEDKPKEMKKGENTEKEVISEEDKAERDNTKMVVSEEAEEVNVTVIEEGEDNTKEGMQQENEKKPFKTENVNMETPIPDTLILLERRENTDSTIPGTFERRKREDIQNKGDNKTKKVNPQTKEYAQILVIPGKKKIIENVEVLERTKGRKKREAEEELWEMQNNSPQAKQIDDRLIIPVIKIKQIDNENMKNNEHRNTTNTKGLITKDNQDQENKNSKYSKAKNNEDIKHTIMTHGERNTTINPKNRELEEFLIIPGKQKEIGNVEVFERRKTKDGKPNGRSKEDKKQNHQSKEYTESLIIPRREMGGNMGVEIFQRKKRKENTDTLVIPRKLGGQDGVETFERRKRTDNTHNRKEKGKDEVKSDMKAKKTNDKNVSKGNGKGKKKGKNVSKGNGNGKKPTQRNDKVKRPADLKKPSLIRAKLKKTPLRLRTQNPDHNSQEDDPIDCDDDPEDTTESHTPHYGAAFIRRKRNMDHRRRTSQQKHESKDEGDITGRRKRKVISRGGHYIVWSRSGSSPWSSTGYDSYSGGSATRNYNQGSSWLLPGAKLGGAVPQGYAGPQSQGAPVQRKKLNQSFKREIAQYAIVYGAKKAALHYEKNIGRRLRDRVVEKFVSRYQERKKRKRRRRRRRLGHVEKVEEK